MLRLLRSAKTSFLAALLVLLLLPSEQLTAHRPIFTKDLASSPSTAIPIAEPEISQVVYREITKDSPQVWLTFSVPADFELFAQIGVPVIDRLKEFRPAMVVVGPGLSGKAPFEIPKNTGAKILRTKEVTKPRFFHEHFTGTDSWILRSETVALPKAGRYYLVACSGQGQTGKLWLSVGRKESFTLSDIKQFPTWRQKIRQFHEVKEESR